MKSLIPAPIAAALPKNRQQANQAGERPFAGNEDPCGVFLRLVNTIKHLWPRKTAATVSHLTGTNERTVQFWLACSTRMSVEAVAALLRTDAGYEILEAIMGDCKAEWWLTTQNAHELRRTRREIAAAQKRIDAAKARQSQIDLFGQ
jgi:hypothetical protein